MVTFPVVSEGKYPDAGRACADYYSPLSAGEKPCVILVHGWGSRSALPLLKMADDLAVRGIAALVLYQPFHSRCAPKAIRKKGTHLSGEEWFSTYQMAVTDIMHLVDWLETRPEIDSNHIGIIGLSLGAFVGAIASAIDPRIKTDILVVSGGNGGKIRQFSRFAVFRKEYAVSPQQFEIDQKKYYEFLYQANVQGWDKVVPGKKEFLTDPLTYACNLKQKPILMINARWDEFIPKEATLELWQAIGEPELVWMKTTHATIWAFYPRILKQVYDFLQKNL